MRQTEPTSHLLRLHRTAGTGSVPRKPLPCTYGGGTASKPIPLYGIGYFTPPKRKIWRSSGEHVVGLLRGGGVRVLQQGKRGYGRRACGHPQPPRRPPRGSCRRPSGRKPLFYLL